MRVYRYDHVHLRSPDPDATARFFETMFGAEVARSIYPAGTLYPGQQRISMRRAPGQSVAESSTFHGASARHARPVSTRTS